LFGAGVPAVPPLIAPAHRSQTFKLRLFLSKPHLSPKAFFYKITAFGGLFLGGGYFFFIFLALPKKMPFFVFLAPFPFPQKGKTACFFGCFLLISPLFWLKNGLF